MVIDQLQVHVGSWVWTPQSSEWFCWQSSVLWLGTCQCRSQHGPRGHRGRRGTRASSSQLSATEQDSPKTSRLLFYVTLTVNLDAYVNASRGPTSKSPRFWGTVPCPHFTRKRATGTVNTRWPRQVDGELAWTPCAANLHSESFLPSQLAPVYLKKIFFSWC